MVKKSFSSEVDQHDSKVFRETLGTFGTTTKPGGNQLEELQTKVRQGVKHVELHLASQGKGQFGVQDVPDKYGFEQRRTIMQLAKLNKQSLSVHGTFEVVSFSGLNQGGFDDSQRLNAMKEIDETLSFAAETAKQGAVVFHLQGEGLSTDRGELNISKKYMKWLEKNKPDEFKKLSKNYFTSNPLDRQFVSDPNKEIDIKEEFLELKSKNKREYQKYLNLANGDENSAWSIYYKEVIETKRKLSPDMQPLVVIGDKLGQTQRDQDLININYFKNKDKISNKDKEIFKQLGVDIENFDISTLQRSQAFFSNGFPAELEGKYSKEDYNNLKKKVLITYEDVLSKNNYLQAQADEAFHKKLLEFQINTTKLQRDDIEQNYIINEEYLGEIKELESKERELVSKIKTAKLNGNKIEEKKLRKQLNGGITETQEKEIFELEQKAKNPKISQQELQQIQNRYQQLQEEIRYSGVQKKKLILMNDIGQIEYQKLEKYDEMKSQFNEQIKKLEDQEKDVKAVTDVTFEKNTSAIGHLGIKAMRYQLDMKEKSKDAKIKIDAINSTVKQLEKEYENANSNRKNNIYIQIQKEKYKLKRLVGLKDYADIDIVNKPLYLAPENMLPGMGSLTSLEEFKGVIRMSQEDFAKKILSNESEYKRLKEEYEKETGLKIKTHDDAIKLAKRHIGGTFDNAHAAVWYKHFRKKEGESEENRMDRFNSWLNQQAEDMVRDGIVKHIHFNDTQAKDDDHNLLGQGVLDLHDMRERLRKAGLKEALIVEAGGRGAQSNMHILNALDIFNPTLSYNNSRTNMSSTSSGVSDWMSVSRNYEQRPQHTQYGMGYSAFKHIPPERGPKGSWSGTGFL